MPGEYTDFVCPLLGNGSRIKFSDGTAVVFKRLTADAGI